MRDVAKVRTKIESCGILLGKSALQFLGFSGQGGRGSCVAPRGGSTFFTGGIALN